MPALQGRGPRASLGAKPKGEGFSCPGTGSLRDWRHLHPFKRNWGHNYPRELVLTSQNMNPASAGLLGFLLTVGQASRDAGVWNEGFGQPVAV